MPKKKKPFSPAERIENEYRRGLEHSILNRIGAAGKGAQGILQSLHQLSETNLLFEYARILARRMITHVRASNARSWREAASKAGKGPEMYAALKTELKGPVGDRIRELLTENARLIKSLPSELAEKASHDIAEMQQKGMRAADISKYIRQRVPKLAKSRIALIARTEASKAATALTQVRSEQLEIPAYEWSSVRDSRTRPGHRHMDGVLVFWDDPPDPEKLVGEKSSGAPYHAGNIYNCRCSPLPLVSLDEVRWPKKVFHNGAISYWTRSKFVDYLRRIGARAA